LKVIGVPPQYKSLKSIKLKQYFTYKDAKSAKFWSIELEKNKIVTAFGKIGNAGTTQTKECIDVPKAQKEADTLITEKIKKGYELEPNIVGLTESEFWNLIEKAKSKADDQDEQIELLREMLSERSEADILEFQNLFNRFHAHSYQSDLWAAAYIINGGCSDDGFEYFRGWLIAQGKTVYDNALANPESLTKVIKAEDMGEIECEEMMSVAGDAYENRTGIEYDDFLNMVTHYKYPELVFDWNDDNVDKKYPKLYKKSLLA
jgi:predicted DNA-binding WGR domain protein